MNYEELKENCEKLNISLDNRQIEQFQEYLRLLQEWNEKINLTAITEASQVIEKHFLDSILPLAECNISGRIADVGTGAGFPGVVWKIVRPELDVSLIEPTGKRCTFLNEVIKELKLENIHVFNERSEEHVKNYRESYDIVTARAVANLRVLSELTVPLLKKDGYLVAMKGDKGHEEAKEAEHAMKVLGCKLIKETDTQLFEGDHRVNLVYHKTEHTPPQYPRNYGQIKKKPL